MKLFFSKVISSILQILLFSLIPFIWWLVTARKQQKFTEWIGLKKICGGKKTIKFITGFLLFIAAIAACFFIHRQLLRKDGFVGIERVQIEDVNYQYASFQLSKEGKTIGLIDDWQINEVPEDKSHTFLVVRSFLDQYYIVREDYEIPTGGNVSCAYIGTLMERTTDTKLLQALTEILQNDYTDGTPFFLSNHKDEQGNFKHIVVGYEDCPVGTDHRIYYIGQVDSRWVIVFRDELGEWENDRLPAVYYELDPKYGEVFEESGFWD